MHNKKYTWKKGAFGSVTRIYDGAEQIGELRTESFKQRSDANVRAAKYRFETKGTFKSYTSIIDHQGLVVGDISYANWSGKVSLNIMGKLYTWKATTWLGTSHELEDANGNVLFASQNFGGNTIEGFVENDLLLLTAIFLKNRQAQYLAVIVIVVAVIVINSR